EEMVGQSIRKIIPDDKQHEEDDVLQRIRRGERVHHFQTVRVRKDGKHVFVSLTISPVLDEDGRIIGASKIARDITAQRLDELRVAGEGQAFEMLAHGADLRDVLTVLVQTLEGPGDGLKASILLLDDERKHLHMGAAPSL